MRILLTGATSFVGRHLVPLLEAHGHDIVAIVRSERARPHEVEWGFHGPLPDIPRCDIVVHLAAHVDFHNALSVDLYRVNTLATLIVALRARTWGAPMIFASAAGVQGTSGTITHDTSINPQNGYMMSKYMGEEAIRSVHDRYTILRMSGIYGVGGPKHLGLNNAITEALQHGTAPVLRGSGRARRNYICVMDVARWIAHLITAYERGQDPAQLLFIAGPEIMTISEYLATISSILAKNKTIKQELGDRGDDMIVQASNPPFPLRTFREYLVSTQ